MPRATGQIILDSLIMDEVHNVFESLPEGERTAENKALLIANAYMPRESSGVIVLDTYWKQQEDLVNQAINQALLGEKDTK